MNLFDEIRSSHERQRELCRSVTSARLDAAERQSLFLQLKVELDAHAAAEERWLYVPLLMTDGGLAVSRHALKEHHDIEELLEELSVADKSGAAWARKARKLSEEVHHHLDEEESKFFKVAGRMLSTTKKTQLARLYSREIVRMRRKCADDYASVSVGSSGHVKAASTNRQTPPTKRQSTGTAAARM
jgi:Hemerythrin HHE cation binding domain